MHLWQIVFCLKKLWKFGSLHNLKRHEILSLLKHLILCYIVFKVKIVLGNILFSNQKISAKLGIQQFKKRGNLEISKPHSLFYCFNLKDDDKNLLSFFTENLIFWNIFIKNDRQQTKIQFKWFFMTTKYKLNKTQFAYNLPN